MSNSQLVWKNQTQLRTGYTTGSCAAAASKAAARMLFTEEEIQEISLMTPAGIQLYLDVKDISKSESCVSCAIQKDSGDDPDVTHEAYIYAMVSYRKEEDTQENGYFTCEEDSHIILKAGKGVGVVTKVGLEQPIGMPAINKVPRQMIMQAVSEERRASNIDKDITITVWIPQGEELAKKTFNPKLGILGGISILGTSGIVQPMSEKALTDTILVEMKLRKANGVDYCFIVPGNYGTDFLSETFGYDEEKTVKCSNYIGETLDDAVNLNLKGVLLVGHIGKFVKLAAGIMNTHSHQADGRMEVLGVHGAMAGLSQESVIELMSCITTTAALEILKREQVLEKTMETITQKAYEHLKRRVGDALEIGIVIFSKEEGVLGKTFNVDELVERIRIQS